jgi:hypothetical protein
MTDTSKLRELEKLERTIVKGLDAFERRNLLIYELMSEGSRQIDITRTINAVRRRMNASEITPDAIAATVKRLERKTAK